MECLFQEEAFLETMDHVKKKKKIPKHVSQIRGEKFYPEVSHVADSSCSDPDRDKNYVLLEKHSPAMTL